VWSLFSLSFAISGATLAGLLVGSKLAWLVGRLLCCKCAVLQAMGIQSDIMSD